VAGRFDRFRPAAPTGAIAESPDRHELDAAIPSCICSAASKIESSWADLFRLPGRKGDYFEIRPEAMFEMVRPD
jgi:hypothetical protein